jgi:hypothetical protein
MVVVALVALAVGGLREHARLKRLSEKHCRRAIFFARRGEPYRLAGPNHPLQQTRPAI